jgi:2-haloacid dehalogenase
MQIVIGNVLSSKELGLVRAALARARFVDGAATAGFAARPVKNNRQAEGSDRSLGAIRKLVAERVLGNEVFRLAVRPKALSPLLFSRYEKGMRYGSHVDDALMDGMRTDVSFTLFLSEPESYDGGELAIEGVSGEETFKLDAGALVAYSATSLHHHRGDARRAPCRRRLGEKLRSRSGAAGTPLRSRYRAPADVCARRQIERIRPCLEVIGQSAAHVGGGLTPACAVATRSTFSNLVGCRSPSNVRWMRMSNIPLAGVQACVFDAYGTLFDFASAARSCRDVLGEAIDKLTALWRDKQLQYTWLRAVQGRHADFWQVTSDALDFALETLALDKPGLRDRLMNLYLTLEPFPEVPEVLERLKTSGLRTAILSNGSPMMLDAVVRASRLNSLIDAVLSSKRSASISRIPRFTSLRSIGSGSPPLRSRSNRRTRGMRTRHRRSACRSCGAIVMGSGRNGCPANLTGPCDR